MVARCWLLRIFRGSVLLILLILLTALPAAFGAEPESNGKPSAVVDQLHAALIDVMKNADTLGYTGRHEKLAPVLVRLFDTGYMAQKSVGRHWKHAREEARTQLVDTFTRFMIANYAGRFDGYSGQRFETLREEPSLRGTVLVHSRLVEEDTEAVQLNYRLRVVDGKWKIIDVFLNGTVSEVALRRSEYSSLIRKQGFDALLAALNEKIQNLARSEPADQT